MEVDICALHLRSHSRKEGETNNSVKKIVEAELF